MVNDDQDHTAVYDPVFEERKRREALVKVWSKESLECPRHYQKVDNLKAL